MKAGIERNALTVGVALAGGAGAGSGTVAVSVLKGGAKTNIEDSAITTSGHVRAEAAFAKGAAATDLTKVLSGEQGSDLGETMKHAQKGIEDAQTDAKDSGRDEAPRVNEESPGSLNATGQFNDSLQACGI